MLAETMMMSGECRAEFKSLFPQNQYRYRFEVFSLSRKIYRLHKKNWIKTTRAQKL
jgi:hypothetical protein